MKNFQEQSSLENCHDNENLNKGYGFIDDDTNHIWLKSLIKDDKLDFEHFLLFIFTFYLTYTEALIMIRNIKWYYVQNISHWDDLNPDLKVKTFESKVMLSRCEYFLEHYSEEKC